MTTNAQFLDRVLVKCRRVGDPNLRAVAPAELSEMLDSWHKASFLPNFLETTSSGLVTVANSNTVDLPADYLLMIENTKLKYQTTAGKWCTIVRRYHEDIEDQYDNADPGVPLAYDFFTGKIYLGPTSDAAYPLRLKYYAKSTEIPDDNTLLTNLWAINAPGLVIASIAAKLVGTYIKDKTTAGELQTESNQIRNELFKFNESQKHVDMDYSVDR